MIDALLGERWRRVASAYVRVDGLLVPAPVVATLSPENDPRCITVVISQLNGATHELYVWDSYGYGDINVGRLGETMRTYPGVSLSELMQATSNAAAIALIRDALWAAVRQWCDDMLPLVAP